MAGTLVLSNALTSNGKQPGFRRNRAYNCLSFAMENTEGFAQVTPPPKPSEACRERNVVVTAGDRSPIASARS